MKRTGRWIPTVHKPVLGNLPFKFYSMIKAHVNFILPDSSWVEGEGSITSKIGNYFQWITKIMSELLWDSSYFNCPNVERLDIYTHPRRQTETGSSESDSFHLP